MPEHILSLSYGKDSMACFGACELLGWPIDRVVTAEVWATDTIPADLPPMVEFKAKADKLSGSAGALRWSMSEDDTPMSKRFIASLAEKSARGQYTAGRYRRGRGATAT